MSIRDARRTPPHRPTRSAAPSFAGTATSGRIPAWSPLRRGGRAAPVASALALAVFRASPPQKARRARCASDLVERGFSARLSATSAGVSYATAWRSASALKIELGSIRVVAMPRLGAICSSWRTPSTKSRKSNAQDDHREVIGSHQRLGRSIPVFILFALGTAVFLFLGSLLRWRSGNGIRRTR